MSDETAVAIEETVEITPEMEGELNAMGKGEEE